MGVIKRGILGGFSGKVANVVGSSWKGIATMRALPLSVANPNTQAQQKVRGRFSHLAHLGSELLASIIKPMWDRHAQHMSGYNAFIQANKFAFTKENEFVPADFIIARGQMTATEILNVRVMDATSIDIVIDETASGAFMSESDEMFGVILDEQGNLQGFSKLPALRSEGGLTIEVENSAIKGYAYVAARSEDGKIISQTSYQSFDLT